jgi:aminoglycoside phosphotransferase (APT) family kinase protein
MRELTRRGFGPDATDGIRIPQPLGYIDRLRMVLMEDVAGTPLDLSSPQLDDPLRRVAQALVKIHHCPVPVEKERDADERIQRLKRAVSDIPAARPDLAETVDRCLRRLKKLADNLPAHEPGLVHGSLSTQEVLLSGSELTILDLDKISLSDPALDVGNFLAHIVWSGRRLAWPEAVVRSHAQTFLSAYQPESPAKLRQRIDFYHRACLLKIARRVALSPEGQHLTASLLKEAMKEGMP